MAQSSSRMVLQSMRDDRTVRSRIPSNRIIAPPATPIRNRRSLGSVPSTATQHRQVKAHTSTGAWRNPVIPQPRFTETPGELQALFVKPVSVQTIKAAGFEVEHLSQQQYNLASRLLNTIPQDDPTQIQSQQNTRDGRDDPSSGTQAQVNDYMRNSKKVLSFETLERALNRTLDQANLAKDMIDFLRRQRRDFEWEWPSLDREIIYRCWSIGQELLMLKSIQELDSYDYKRSGGSRPWNWDWSVQKFILEGIPVLAHYERDFIELSLRGCPGDYVLDPDKQSCLPSTPPVDCLTGPVLPVDPQFESRAEMYILILRNGQGDRLTYGQYRHLAKWVDWYQENMEDVEPPQKTPPSRTKSPKSTSGKKKTIKKPPKFKQQTGLDNQRDTDMFFKIDSALNNNGRKPWTRSNTEEQGLRRYLPKYGDVPMARQWAKVAADYIDRIQSKLKASDDDKIPFDTIDIGWTAVPNDRMIQHWRHQSSNQLMNLIESVCTALFPTEHFRFHYRTVHLLHEAPLAKLVEHFLSRICGSYSSDGGTNTVFGGRSVHSADKAKPEKYNENVREIIQTGIFDQNMERIKISVKYETLRAQAYAKQQRIGKELKKLIPAVVGQTQAAIAHLKNEQRKRKEMQQEANRVAKIVYRKWHAGLEMKKAASITEEVWESLDDAGVLSADVSAFVARIRSARDSSSRRLIE